ncbi:HlyD family secretion protein [Salaquimonas pukyongi]|uniref:HlyD family secretion protein n=1 Tax=Salaquimonas pukyongi TaxID=2712698 RepID=UPI00096B91E6|nr:HlyD family efflux transporter periplasmic adaptor subunit [Salaquimonas pukyongi]
MTGLLCSLPLAATLIQTCAPPPPLATGYVEGEFVLAAPVETARLETLSVRRGDRVKAGSVLGSLEKRDAEIAVAQARAALAEAKMKLENLRTGRRAEEIAVLEAALTSAAAQANEAERTLERQQNLIKRGATTAARLEDAVTGAEVAKAKVAETRANLAVARLPARPAEISAAEAGVQQAQAALENAQWRLSQRELTLPVAGTVYDIIRNPGEIAGPQAPVLSVLPQGAVKLRVYVPESALAQLSAGSMLAVNCDNCPPGLTASITYIAPDPEFTPPVIYSIDSRQKLVYLVEASPSGGAAMLKPGQIVDVDLAQSGGDGTR